MAGYDVPHVTHDMILRFMGVNFSAITDGSARIPSAVGDDSKPLPVLDDSAPAAPAPTSTKTPEQDKAMWEGACPSSFPLSSPPLPPFFLLLRPPLVLSPFSYCVHAER